MYNSSRIFYKNSYRIPIGIPFNSEYRNVTKYVMTRTGQVPCKESAVKLEYTITRY